MADAENTMAQVKRRYTTIEGPDWIVSATWDERALEKAHWFEVQIEAVEEKTGRKYPFPREIRTYRIGETEHPFRDYVNIDWDGDREAAINHLLGTIYRRVYDYIERGH
jgi:hypothetical protein